VFTYDIESGRTSMLRTEMPWYIKLGTAILATAFGGGCIIAILLVLPTGLALDLGNWLRRPMLEEQRIRTLVGGQTVAPRKY
jgi:hypothetical protein